MSAKKNKDKLLKEYNSKSNHQLLKSFFMKNGYLFIKGMFSKDSILRIREEICDVLALEKVIETENVINAIPKLAPYHINSPQFHRLTEQVLKKEIAHTLAYDKNLLRLLENLLSKPIYPHPNKMFRVCYPSKINSDYITPPHQDIYYIKGEKDTFTAWVPLGNYESFEGGLKVLAGTHKKGLYPISEKQEKQFLKCAIADISSEDNQWLSAKYEMGDCLIMHSLTVHSGNQNAGESLRLSIDYRFSALNGDINEEQLNPLFFSSNKSWAEMTKGWSNNLPVAIIPKSLNVLPKHTALEKSLEKPSVFTEI